MLTDKQRYKLFKHTLWECSSDILSLDDVFFFFFIFEELPIDMRCYLYKDALDALFESGYIDEKIYNKVSDLRDYYFQVEHELHKEGIRESREIQHIMKLADEINSLLYM